MMAKVKVDSVKRPVPLHKLTDKTPRNDKKRYQFIPMTQDMAMQPPELEGKTFAYGRSGSCMTDDKGIADEIEAKYGKGEVQVWELEDKWHPADWGHKYKFSGIKMPWHQYNELGERIDVIIPLSETRDDKDEKEEKVGTNG
jgi:hypothetical protein